MIGLIFQFASEHIEVNIKGNSVLFRTSQFMQFASIDGIRLNKAGVIKEFPDLKENKDWQDIARERFKDKIKKMKTEKEIADYIVKDLRKFGYTPLFKQKQGFRPEKIK